MERKVVLTGDASTTLYSPRFKQHYHSTHGALQESLHVFIRAGLQHPALLFLQELEQPLEVLEMGFGTGLNALLTFADKAWEKKPMRYTSLELYPLLKEEWRKLQSYSEAHNMPIEPLWQQIQSAPWNQACALSSQRYLHKLQVDILEWKPPKATYHLIYYDAFAPNSQPELWTEEVFLKLYQAMASGGLLVTYCVKGSVRRALQAAGFEVEKIPGPPGKREMTRALKNRNS